MKEYKLNTQREGKMHLLAKIEIKKRSSIEKKTERGERLSLLVPNVNYFVTSYDKILT